MLSIIFFLLTVPFLQAFSQNCPVVDFGDNLFWYAVGIPPYRSGIDEAKKPERSKIAEGEFINGQPFSMTMPLSMVSADYNTKGNNTRFYGGMKTHCWDNPTNKYTWSEGGSNVDHEGYDDLNFMGAALETPNNRLKAVGVWIWKKEDFINGGDKYPVTFDGNSRVAVFLSRTYPVNEEQARRRIAEGKIPKDARPCVDTYANQQIAVVPREKWGGWETVHLVVQDGAQFYVAEPAFEPIQQTLIEVSPMKVKWTKYNPKGPWDFEFNHKEAMFEPHEFKDVRAAGWMICKNTIENAELWCKWYGFGMDAVVNRPVELQTGWNIPMQKIEKTTGRNGLYMAKTEVSYEQWRRIWKWGQRNAYCMHRSFAFDRDGNMGSMLADGGEHSQREPVTGITWHDAVVWCNALSEYEGRTPCYYADPEFKKILRVSRDGTDIGKSLIPPAVHVKWDADGYRLPTSDEWLKGVPDADKAWTSANSGGRTHETGTSPASVSGFHDLIGNAWEYIWDRLGNVCDMTKERTRTVLGGDYRYPAVVSEVSALPSGEIPSRGHYAIGFRPVRHEGGGLSVLPKGISAKAGVWELDGKAPAWTFESEQIIPPAKPADIKALAPSIEMLKMGAFEGGKMEVSYAQWRKVFQWAEVSGYRFSWDGDMGSMAWDSEPASHSQEEPVTCVGLLDAAVWCNALSEMKGYKPCYYLDEARTQPLKIVDPFRVISYQWTEGSTRDGGTHKILPKFLFYMDETADGYRLPMTDEWSAMCGAGKYPSGESFDPATAWYAGNSNDRTHPVGKMKATGIGFHDLSGNVFEWAIAKAKTPNPKTGMFFNLEARGGSFRSDDKSPKTLGKTPMKGAWDWISNGVAVPELGFRVVRNAVSAP